MSNEITVSVPGGENYAGTNLTITPNTGETVSTILDTIETRDIIGISIEINRAHAKNVRQLNTYSLCNSVKKQFNKILDEMPNLKQLLELDTSVIEKTPSKAKSNEKLSMYKISLIIDSSIWDMEEELLRKTVFDLQTFSTRLLQEISKFLQAYNLAGFSTMRYHVEYADGTKNVLFAEYLKGVIPTERKTDIMKEKIHLGKKVGELEMQFVYVDPNDESKEEQRTETVDIHVNDLIRQYITFGIDPKNTKLHIDTHFAMGNVVKSKVRDVNGEIFQAFIATTGKSSSATFNRYATPEKIFASDDEDDELSQISESSRNSVRVLGEDGTVDHKLYGLSDRVKGVKRRSEHMNYSLALNSSEKFYWKRCFVDRPTILWMAAIRPLGHTPGNVAAFRFQMEFGIHFHSSRKDTSLLGEEPENVINPLITTDSGVFDHFTLNDNDTEVLTAGYTNIGKIKSERKFSSYVVDVPIKYFQTIENYHDIHTRLYKVLCVSLSKIFQNYTRSIVNDVKDSDKQPSPIDKIVSNMIYDEKEAIIKRLFFYNVRFTRAFEERVEQFFSPERVEKLKKEREEFYAKNQENDGKFTNGGKSKKSGKTGVVITT